MIIICEPRAFLDGVCMIKNSCAIITPYNIEVSVLDQFDILNVLHDDDTKNCPNCVHSVKCTQSQYGAVTENYCTDCSCLGMYRHLYLLAVMTTILNRHRVVSN